MERLFRQANIDKLGVRGLQRQHDGLTDEIEKKQELLKKLKRELILEKCQAKAEKSFT